MSRQLREDPATKHIPVVMYSAAYVSEADRQRALASGATEYLPRTPDAAELLQMLATILAGRPTPSP